MTSSPPPNHASATSSIDTDGAEAGASLLQRPFLDNNNSADTLGIDPKEWFSIVHRVNQQDVMMKAIIKIFAWLNGAVILFILAAWGLGFLSERAPIITERVVIALISSTLIQAGLAFITITKFLFPANSENHLGRRGHRKAGRSAPSAVETPNRPQAAV